MGKTTKIATGAIVAGVAGYVAGILTAPKSGKETREDIKAAALRAKTEAEKKLKVLHSELGALLRQAKHQGEEKTGKAKEELLDAVESAKVAKQKIREILSAIHEGDAHDPDLDAAIQQAKDAKAHLAKFIRS